MKNINGKFTLLGGLVLYCCAGTFSVVKACMLLPQCRQFAECDLDSECVASRLPQFSLVFARQVLNKRSDIARGGDCSKLLSRSSKQ